MLFVVATSAGAWHGGRLADPAFRCNAQYGFNKAAEAD
jgi:hypothetical protein